MDGISKTILKMGIALLPIKGFLIAALYHHIQDGSATPVSYVLIVVFLATSSITIVDANRRIE